MQPRPNVIASGAKQSMPPLAERWIASSLSLLAMTNLARSRPVPQHKTSTAGFTDAVAEIVSLGPRVSADAHLVEGGGAARAQARAEQAWILVTDHGAQALHRTRIHRQCLVTIEAGGELYAPDLCGSERDVLLEPGDE